jgi:16S rRNA (guanine966-N2)-methyltransferase
VRVVAGEFRGRRLTAPASRSIRPTTDRVREAIFNALNSVGVVEGALVVDLFAGSGALGIEALSRGAEHCTFVESDRHALSAIHDNIATLGLTGRTRVMSGDVLAMLPRIDCDLAFADPPYGFTGWLDLLARLRAGFLVAESSATVEASSDWEQQRVKRYGRTWVTFLERS